MLFLQAMFAAQKASLTSQFHLPSGTQVEAEAVQLGLVPAEVVLEHPVASPRDLIFGLGSDGILRGLIIKFTVQVLCGSQVHIRANLTLLCVAHSAVTHVCVGCHVSHKLKEA